MSAASAHLPIPVWDRRRRRAALAAAGSIFLAHLLFLFVLLSDTTQALLLGASAGAPVYVSGDDISASPLDLVADPTPTDGAPAGLDPEFYRKLIDRGYRDLSGLNPEELRKRLEEISAQGQGIDDQTIKEIGKFLGAKQNRKTWRTYYLDELNPNCNYYYSIVARASRFLNAGEAAYTVALRDREGDEQVFTLAGRAARELEAGGLDFGGKTLAPGDAAFELENARFVQAERWRDETKKGIQFDYGTALRLSDPHGREREIHVEHGQGTPWLFVQQRFMVNPFTGKPHFDPDDETTPFNQKFDDRTRRLLDWSELPKGADGETRARIVYVDAKGEREIMITIGPEAEKFLRDMAVVKRGGVAQRIWDAFGADLLQERVNSRAVGKDGN